MLWIGEILLMPATAINAMMVQQLGLAMIPLCCRASSPLISGTTSGTSGSSRKAELLSMYTAPLFLIAGAKRWLMGPSTAPSTKSRPSKLSSVAS